MILLQVLKVWIVTVIYGFILEKSFDSDFSSYAKAILNHLAKILKKTQEKWYLPKDNPRLRADSLAAMIRVGFSGKTFSITAIPEVHWPRSDRPIKNL